MYFSYFYHFYLLSCNNDVIQPTGCKVIKTTPSNYIIWPKSNNVSVSIWSIFLFFFFQMAEKQVRVLFHGNGWFMDHGRIMPLKRTIGANNVSHRIKVDSN